MKCEFYNGQSPKHPRMRCSHFHSGMEWIDFDSRDEMRSWKERYCYGLPAGCPYFTENVGRDTEFENVWLAIVTVIGRDYWRRVASVSGLDEAVQGILREVPLFEMANTIVTAADLQIRVAIVHSSNPGFTTLLDELQFSGKRLEDWPQ